eukprot:TRINITY_DN2330_c0_g1_i3.p2 TRINITY_DN2330_c0_g1~~TRINITY_DN2330_c0_g1_i3.p2  ORF type:complete len:471 (-),score=108.73 TRINITY_DN2330_c0_g1_i3:208-1620(-)
MSRAVVFPRPMSNNTVSRSTTRNSAARSASWRPETSCARWRSATSVQHEPTGAKVFAPGLRAGNTPCPSAWWSIMPMTRELRWEVAVDSTLWSTSVTCKTSLHRCSISSMVVSGAMRSPWAAAAAARSWMRASASGRRRSSSRRHWATGIEPSLASVAAAMAATIESASAASLPSTTWLPIFLGATRMPASFRNRTTEFAATVERLKARQPAASAAAAQPERSKSEFARAAAQVAAGIERTAAQLGKLTKLAQKRQHFDDPAVEIQQMTFVIKEEITSLNIQIDQLQQYVASRKGELAGNKQSQEHSSRVVDSLKGSLASTAGQFKQVLQLRTENVKHQHERRMNFSDLSAASALQSRATDTSLWRKIEEELDGGRVRPAEQEFGKQQQMRVQQQQLQVVQQNHEFLNQRAEAMESIESTIVELGTVFQQLATLVSEQESLVERSVCATVCVLLLLLFVCCAPLSRSGQD